MNECDIFMAALEKDSLQQRQAFLDKACAGDARLRQRIDLLFESHGQAGSLLEHPALGAAATVNPIQGDISTAGAADGRSPPSISSDAISLDFLSPTDDPQALGRLGPYTVSQTIGRGGMGIVLKAHDPRLNRVVAIKVLAPELAANPTARKRFLREAQAAAAVVHQHVVTIHAVDDDRLPYLVMEYIAGQSLQEKIDRAGPLELKEILRIGQQVAAGLAAAHASGLMHRDVKPANILLENGVQRVRISDFGLARAVDDVGMTRPGEVAGTPQYMSPEQALGQPVDARSDLFSLGSVLYAMCTGRSPFRAESMIAALRRVCDDKPRPICDCNPEIPPWLVAIIDRLLAKNPDQRFQTATEVADLLSQHLAQLQNPALPPVRAPIISTSTIHNPKSAYTRWAITAVAVAFLFVGVSLTEATGVSKVVPTVVRIVMGEGTLVVETDPDVHVTIEGNGDLVFNLAGGQSIRVPPGSYQVKATKGGKSIPLEREVVSIAKGDREVVKVKLEALPATPADKLAPLDAARHYLQVAQVQRNSHQAYLALRESLFEAGGGSQPIEVAALYGEALRVFPDDGILHFHLGRVHARFGEWDKAIAAYSRGLELAPADYDAWFHAAPIYLAAGDQQGFRAHCRRMLDEFGQTKDEVIAERTAMMCMLAPDAVDLKLVSSLAELAITRTEKHESYRFFTRAKGLAELRAGRAAEAVRWFERFHPMASGSPFDAGVFAALAMAHQALGNPGDAQAALGKAKSIVSEKMPSPAKGLPFDAWHDWLHADMLLREADATLTKPLPFVLLDPDGRALQNFATLAEAMLKSSDGDTIEICGNGPFMTAPIHLSSRRTIRAGQGFRPVVKPDLVAQSGRMATFLESRAPLVLEGVDFQCAADSTATVLAINSLGAPLFVANCRFVGCMLAVEGHSACQLRNSQFSNQSYAVRCIRGSTAVLDNNILANSSGLAPPLALLWPENIQRMEITRNLFTGGSSGFIVNLGSPRGGQTAGAAQWRLAHNLVSGAGGLLRCNQSITQFDSWTAPLEAAELERQLRERISWHEEQNLYSTGAPLLALSSTQGGPMTPIEPTQPLQTLAEWNQFWGLSDTSSIQGTARFQAGDAVYATPHILEADAFRLRTDSAGYRAGPDGKDLGPDINFVGPGEAYERWKKTPDYEKWLEETGQKK